MFPPYLGTYLHPVTLRRDPDHPASNGHGGAERRSAAKIAIRHQKYCHPGGRSRRFFRTKSRKIEKLSANRTGAEPEHSAAPVPGRRPANPRKNFPPARRATDSGGTAKPTAPNITGELPFTTIRETPPKRVPGTLDSGFPTDHRRAGGPLPPVRAGSPDRAAADRQGVASRGLFGTRPPSGQVDQYFLTTLDGQNHGSS